VCVYYCITYYTGGPSFGLWSQPEPQSSLRGNSESAYANRAAANRAANGPRSPPSREGSLARVTLFVLREKSICTPGQKSAYDPETPTSICTPGQTSAYDSETPTSHIGIKTSGSSCGTAVTATEWKKGRDEGHQRPRDVSDVEEPSSIRPQARALGSSVFAPGSVRARRVREGRGEVRASVCVERKLQPVSI
jgi:hypothetical protein